MSSVASLQKVRKNSHVGNQAFEALQHDLIHASADLTSPTNRVWAQASLQEAQRFPMDRGGPNPQSKSKGVVAHCWNQRHRALLPQSLPPRVVL